MKCHWNTPSLPHSAVLLKSVSWQEAAELRVFLCHDLYLYHFLFQTLLSYACSFIWLQAYTLWVDEKHSGKCRKPLSWSRNRWGRLRECGYLKKKKKKKLITRCPHRNNSWNALNITERWYSEGQIFPLIQHLWKRSHICYGCRSQTVELKCKVHPASGSQLQCAWRLINQRCQ